MSVANLNVTTDHVWLACDTLLFLHDAPYSFGTKCSLFPHLMAVVGFRGLRGLHHRVDVFMNGGGRLLSVENAAAELPERLRLWTDELAGEHPHIDDIRGQVWLCGWRPSTKQFGGWLLESSNFTAVELAVPSTHLNPGIEATGWTPPAVIDDPAKLVRSVEAQRKMSDMSREAGEADLGIGGEVIMVLLDRTGFTIRKAHRFQDYDQVKEQIRDAR